MSTSVIITCYNYGRYLRSCVRSVIDQGAECDELIVVNDGSTDDTVSICLDLGITFLTTPNRGEAHARNAGIRLSTSDKIMCLDADDMIPDGSLSAMNQKSKEGTVVYGAVQECGERIRTIPPSLANYYSLCNQNSIYHNAMFYKSDWLKVGGFDESDILRVGFEDWDYWLRLASIGVRFIGLPDIVLLHRIHSKQQTILSVRDNIEKCAAYVRGKHKLIVDRFKESII